MTSPTFSPIMLFTYCLLNRLRSLRATRLTDPGLTEAAAGSESEGSRGGPGCRSDGASVERGGQGSESVIVNMVGWGSRSEDGLTPHKST